MRFGIGYDVHRFVVSRKLILGGTEIPHVKGLEGHSDADVLSHAICDALLGASALGDIGKHFPDTDPRYKEVSSLEFLRQVGEMLKEKKYQVVNIDTTIVLQQPKVGPYIRRMRENIAQALQLKIDQVSVKATTGEELGFIGLGDGAAAYAVASIKGRDEQINIQF